MKRFNLDDPERTIAARKIARSKPLLREVYNDFYQIFVKTVERIPEGRLVELGSGGGFLSEILPGVITSDVQKVPHINVCLDAEDIPFKEGSLSAIFLMNVFHHIKDPEKFLREAERCLKKQGRIIMIEPANTIWGRFVRQFLPEGFNPEASWRISSFGHLTGANIALPWIVFVRDKDRYEREFPNMPVVRYELHTPLRYFLSGGVGYRSFVPYFFLPLVKGVESIIKSCGLIKYLGLHVTIEIVKKNNEF